MKFNRWVWITWPNRVSTFCWQSIYTISGWSWFYISHCVRINKLYTRLTHQFNKITNWTNRNEPVHLVRIVTDISLSAINLINRKQYFSNEKVIFCMNLMNCVTHLAHCTFPMECKAKLKKCYLQAPVRQGYELWSKFNLIFFHIKHISC